VTVPAVLLVASLVLGILGWRRSGSLTRYRLYTGAPIVWVLLAASCLAALLADRTGNADLASGLVTGGLIGAGLVLAVLVRRAGAAPPRPPVDHDGKEDG
jgi:hypothetical protein